jgi:UDPglucose 6-dehydrogenase
MKKIGYIGQGWVGKHSADAIEKEGTPVIRYSLEPEFIGNKDKIKDCEVVFIVVTARTTPEGFEDKNIREAIELTAPDTLIAIRSTLPPGTIKIFQDDYPDRRFIFYPEFLTMSTAKEDAEKPKRNIIGLSEKATEEDAKTILDIIPKADYVKVTTAINAELSKYITNCYWNFRNMYINMQYDLAEAVGGDWEDLREMFINDDRLPWEHTRPVHNGGRGAGNSCLIKDFAIFSREYKDKVGDKDGSLLLDTMARKNINYLHSTGKDIHFLEEVYGPNYAQIFELDK